MDTSENPYEPPRSVFNALPVTDRRSVGFGLIVIVGMAVGAVAFVHSMLMMPVNVSSTVKFDLYLSIHFGFVYPQLVGLWAAWVRRSVVWAMVGMASAFFIGWSYYLLCGKNFLADLILFPGILGGGASVLLGTKQDSWIQGIPGRFAKGLVAGLALGLVYTVLLNVIGVFVGLNFVRSVETYATLKWLAGTAAMMVASGIFFPLFHWSAGLRRESGNESIQTETP